MVSVAREVEGLIRRRVEAAFRSRYASRDPAPVYVHELLAPVESLPEKRLRPPGTGGIEFWAVVGEAVERGLGDMLGAAPAPRRTVVVETALSEEEVPEAALRALREAGVELLEARGGGLALRVSGSTDLLIEDAPVRLVEVKTTRRRSEVVRDHWVTQAALYSALYGEPVALTVVLLGGDGAGDWLVIRVVDAPSEMLTPVVEAWLTHGPLMVASVVRRYASIYG